MANIATPHAAGSDIRADLNNEERRGFDLALDQIQTWAREIERQAKSLPRVEINSTLATDLSSGARLAGAMAEALRQGFTPPSG